MELIVAGTLLFVGGLLYLFDRRRYLKAQDDFIEKCVVEVRLGVFPVASCRAFEVDPIFLRDSADRLRGKKLARRYSAAERSALGNIFSRLADSLEYGI